MIGSIRVSTRIIVLVFLVVGIVSYFMGYIPSVDEFRIFLNSKIGSVAVLYGAPLLIALLVGTLFGTSVPTVIRGYALGTVTGMFMLSLEAAFVAEGKGTFLGDPSPSKKIFVVTACALVATLFEIPWVTFSSFFIPRKEKKEKNEEQSEKAISNDHLGESQED